MRCGPLAAVALAAAQMSSGERQQHPHSVEPAQQALPQARRVERDEQVEVVVVVNDAVALAVVCQREPLDARRVREQLPHRVIAVTGNDMDVKYNSHCFK